MFRVTASYSLKSGSFARDRLPILYGDKPIKEKCIRVFASNNPADPGVKKVHAVRKTTAKLTNSPEHCFIFNDDVKSVPVPDKLDRQWYIDFANKRLSDFGVV